MTEDINEILQNIEKADNSFIADIKKYWAIVTSIDGFDHIIREPIDGLKQKMPRVPESEWESLVNSYNIPAMEGEYINQFMKHFTHEELKGLLKLYEENPLLIKARQRNKLILSETYKLNEKWMSRFMALFNAKLVQWKELGYIDLPNEL